MDYLFDCPCGKVSVLRSLVTRSWQNNFNDYLFDCSCGEVYVYILRPKNFAIVRLEEELKVSVKWLFLLLYKGFWCTDGSEFKSLQVPADAWHQFKRVARRESAWGEAVHGAPVRDFLFFYWCDECSRDMGSSIGCCVGPTWCDSLPWQRLYVCNLNSSIANFTGQREYIYPEDFPIYSNITWILVVSLGLKRGNFCDLAWKLHHTGSAEYSCCPKRIVLK
jgi:hypothetical protein